MKKIILLVLITIAISGCSFNKCDREINTCGQKIKIGNWLN